MPRLWMTVKGRQLIKLNWIFNTMTKEYLKETAKEYINKFPKRLNNFLNEFEAEENDFLEKEIEYFEYTLWDVEHSESSTDGYSVTSSENFFNAYDLCNEIGWERFMYSTKSKIKFLKSKQPLPAQQKANVKLRYTAKHYVLAYLIECNANGESFPVGQKKELEKIGNRKMGIGKGNRFYKVFNEMINKNLNTEDNLIELGGINWRVIVKDLSDNPDTIETYLQSKQL